jgi:hypothetical protein
MFVRPARRIGRGGLLRTAAATAVVAGTATAVSGGVRRHQDNNARQAAEAQAYEQQRYAPPAPQYAAPAPQYAAPAAPAGDPDLIAKLTELGQLKTQGILTDAEFAVAKAKLLG